MDRTSVFRPSCLLVGLAFCTLAPAQNRLEARKITSPPKDLGTYDLSTRTWSRSAGGLAALSQDAIYRNDAFNGYFGNGFVQCTVMDEIMLPGPTNPRPGPQEQYLIDCWDFAYCAAGVGTVTFTFWYGDSYFPCDVPGAGFGGCANASCQNVVAGPFRLSGLPAANYQIGCWIANISIADGYEFCFEADGAPCFPGYQGLLLGQDHGFLAFQFTLNTTMPQFGGPILAGNPAWVPYGYNTCYDPSDMPCDSGTGTGLGATTAMGRYPYGEGFGLCNANLTGCAAPPGCYFFGGYQVTGQPCGWAGNPLAQFLYVLYADCTKGNCDEDGVYCDEGTNPHNVADVSVSSKDVSGGAAITVDAVNAPANVNGYLLVGAGRQAVQDPPGAKGALCVVGGCQGRYAADIHSSGAGGTFSTGVKDPTTACGMMGAGDYCLPGSCGPANVLPGSTWNFQYWHRQPMMQPASFSSAIKCTFQ